MSKNTPLQFEYLQTRLDKDQLLLDNIKARLPELERWIVPFQIMDEMESIAFIITHSKFINCRIAHCE